jgi:hypothetical protein
LLSILSDYIDWYAIIWYHMMATGFNCYGVGY